MDGSTFLKETSAKWRTLSTLEKEKNCQEAAEIRKIPLTGLDRKSIIENQLKTISQSVNVWGSTKMSTILSVQLQHKSTVHVLFGKKVLGSLIKDKKWCCIVKYFNTTETDEQLK